SVKYRLACLLFNNKKTADWAVFYGRSNGLTDVVGWKMLYWIWLRVLLWI
ncbi:MAG: hypothetical protein ACI965_001143, partial [Paraglaciecola sp.]